ncbi:hypothetical protein BsWGS_28754 [Bradybaena similaris]
MFPQIRMLIVILCLAQAAQGLHVSMNRTPDTNFCARLKCVASVKDDIKSIIGLKIYEVTLKQKRFKLASVSVFEPSPHLEQARSDVLSVTGAVSLNHVDLMVGFRDASDCLYGSFLCELNFLNASGQLASMTELTTPVGENLDSILLSRVTARLEALFADVNKGMGSLEAKFDNLEAKCDKFEAKFDKFETTFDNLEAKCDKVESKFDNLLSQLLALQQLRNESYEILQLDGCYKGMPSAVALMKVHLWKNVEALCDTHTDGGGWNIFQRRTKGDVSFFRNWVEYKKGFGNADTDYWLGNDVISNLTSLGYNELRVDLKKKLRKYFAHYSMFKVADETVNYQLTVSGYNGTAGDGLKYHNSQFFSTYDRDNDNYSGNCAILYIGAWWYNGCNQANLNGLFGVNNYVGASWESTIKESSADFTEMKIRQS